MAFCTGVAATGIFCNLISPLVDSSSAYPLFNGSEYNASQTCHLSLQAVTFSVCFYFGKERKSVVDASWGLMPSHLPLPYTGSGALANVMMQWQGFTGSAPLAAAGVFSVLSIIAVSSAFNENVGNSSSSIWRPLVQAVQSLRGVNSF